MIALALMLALSQAANPFDQFDPKPATFSGPAKLVIVTGPAGGTAVVDYPTLARCQRAADATEAEWKRRYTEARQRPQQPNTFVTGPAFTAFAFCIPA